MWPSSFIVIWLLQISVVHAGRPAIILVKKIKKLSRNSLSKSVPEGPSKKKEFLLIIGPRLQVNSDCT